MSEANVWGHKSYKPSNTPLVGKIPQQWKSIRVKDVIERIGNGVTPKGGSEVYTDSGVPFLRSQNVYDNGLRLANVSFIPKSIHEAMKNSQLRPNDILINITGASIGRTCLVPEELGDANINQHIAFLRLKKRYNPVYMAWFLKSSMLKEYIQLEQAGASKEAFNLSQIANIPVFLPSPEEQQAITDYLDTKTAQIDRKIDLLEQKAQKYCELKQSLINETVTRGLDKSVPTKESGISWIGNIPKHWDLGFVGGVANPISTKNHPNEELLSVYRDHGVVIKSSRDDNNNKPGSNLANYKLVEPGFLVINKMKAWQGSLGVSEFRGIVSPAYITCKTDKKLVKRRYFHNLLRSQRYINHYNRLSYGVRVDQWDMRYHDFKYTPVPLPPLEEQETIADYLDEKTVHIDKIVKTIRAQVDKLTELRKTLINDVVIGEIRVADV